MAAYNNTKHPLPACKGAPIHPGGAVTTSAIKQNKTKKKMEHAQGKVNFHVSVLMTLMEFALTRRVRKKEDVKQRKCRGISGDYVKSGELVAKYEENSRKMPIFELVSYFGISWKRCKVWR